MNTSETWDIVERKMLELRILTNANWRNQEFELAVLGEKTLRSIEAAKASAEKARLIMENLQEAPMGVDQASQVALVSEEQTLIA
jgi:hypothetical protein